MRKENNVHSQSKEGHMSYEVSQKLLETIPYNVNNLLRRD